MDNPDATTQPSSSTPSRWDYVSPNLKTIQPDAAFPFMQVGEASTCSWPYLRQNIPHNWYVDRRAPQIGFVSRDEASLLHNLALACANKQALEIGCWLGWSAVHLALGGVTLDVIDPILLQEDFRQSVVQSLTAAGVLERVTLLGGYSPQGVLELAARTGRRWSLIFIDGNHEEPAPLMDAIACEPVSEKDAIIVFHDLASPAVGRGLDWYRERGWQTRIYQTMQIMGVAWRGDIQPPVHYPDPSIEWHLPEHLRQHPVSPA